MARTIRTKQTLGERDSLREEIDAATRRHLGAEQAAETANTALRHYKEKLATTERERDRIRAEIDAELAHLEDLLSARQKTILDLCDERAEVIALLEERTSAAPWPGSFCTYPLTETCAWLGSREPCWQHRRISLLARLRVPVRLPEFM